MALAFTNLETSSATNAISGFTATTGSVAIPDDSVCYLFAGAAGNSSSPAVTITTPVMTGLTFTSIGTAVYGSRRRGEVFRAINTTGSTVTATIDIGIDPGANTAQEVMWSIVLATDADTTTPNGTVATPATASGGTTATATVTGTPGAGAAVLAFFAHTGASAAMTLTGETDVSLVELGSGTNVRRIKAAYDLSPDSSPTASVSWTGNEDSFAVAFIVNAGSGGGGDTATATPASGAATVSAAGKSDAATTATAAAGVATVSGVGGTLTALVSSAFKNNTGTALASLTDVTVWVYSLTSGALVVKKTGQTTNGSGVLTLQDAAISSATTYRVVFRNEDDGAEGMETLTAS